MDKINWDEKLRDGMRFDPADANTSFGAGYSRDKKKAKQVTPPSPPKKQTQTGNAAAGTGRSNQKSGTAPSGSKSAPPTAPTRPARSGASAGSVADRIREKLPYILGAALLVLLFGLLIRGCNSPHRRIGNMLEEGSYNEAVSTYLEEVKGNEYMENRLLDEFMDSVHSIKTRYAAQEISCQSAGVLLTELGRIGSEALTEEITAVQKIMSDLDRGEQLCAAGDYAGAIEVCLQVDGSDGMDRRIGNCLTKCVSALVTDAKNVRIIAPGDEEAELLKAAALLQTDGGHTKEAAQLEEAYVELMTRITEDRIERKVFSDDVYDRLCDGSAVFPENKALSALLSGYRLQLEAYVTEQVDQYLKEYEFARAEELVSEKLKSDPENERFLKLQKRIATEKSVYDEAVTAHVLELLAGEKYDDALAYLDDRMKESSNNPTLINLFNNTRKTYLDLIRTEYQTYRDQGEYVRALKLLYGKIEQYPGDSVFLDWLEDVCTTRMEKAAEVRKKTAPENQCPPGGADITMDSPPKLFPVSYTVAGVYSIRSSEMVNGLKVRVRMLNSKGEELFDQYYENDQEHTFRLTQDDSYQMEVTPVAGEGHYRMEIWKPKKTVRIDGYDVIHDSIAYLDQENFYSFTPGVDGLYRFDVSDMVNGLAVRITVTDHLNFPVNAVREDSSLTIDEGQSFDLIGGQTYRVAVTQVSGTGSYKMTVGRQQERLPMASGIALDDAITFVDQHNQYSFTADHTKRYTLRVRGMASGMKVSVSVLNDNNYQVGETATLANGEALQLDLEEGEKYFITVRYDTDFGVYQVRIS